MPHWQCCRWECGRCRVERNHRILPHGRWLTRIPSRLRRPHRGSRQIRAQQNWPARFFYKNPRERTLDNSLVSGGCVIEDAEISNTVIFQRCKIQEDSLVEYSVMLPECRIGRKCIVRNAILDRYCDVPDGLQIGVNREQDEKYFRVSKTGIVLVNQNMLDRYKADHPKK